MDPWWTRRSWSTLLPSWEAALESAPEKQGNEVKCFQIHPQCRRTTLLSWGFGSAISKSRKWILPMLLALMHLESQFRTQTYAWRWFIRPNLTTRQLSWRCGLVLDVGLPSILQPTLALGPPRSQGSGQRNWWRTYPDCQVISFLHRCTTGQMGICTWCGGFVFQRGERWVPRQLGHPMGRTSLGKHWSFWEYLRSEFRLLALVATLLSSYQPSRPLSCTLLFDSISSTPMSAYPRRCCRKWKSGQSY